MKDFELTVPDLYLFFFHICQNIDKFSYVHSQETPFHVSCLLLFSNHFQNKFKKILSKPLWSEFINVMGLQLVICIASRSFLGIKLKIFFLAEGKV